MGAHTDFGLAAGLCCVQLCLSLLDPMDCSLPGSSVHGISQARILAWFAVPFSGGSSQPRDRTQVSCTAGRLSTVWAAREAQQGQIDTEAQRLKGKKKKKQVGGAQIARCPKMPISASCWLPVVATAKGPRGVYNDGNRSIIRMRELFLQGTCPLLPRWQDQLVAFWILSAFPSPPRAPFLGRVLMKCFPF